uniref:WD_REPEATS_REGION domain-containing protein n=1 Tax=Glossina pallidipes TaxID=7398 RepID=A0A1B0A1M3_GLOPL
MSVYSCSLHPHNELCATGGEDDKVFVCNRNTGQILYEFTEHKNTVTDVHFNRNGTYLATADLADDIVLHKLQTMSSESDKDGGNLVFHKRFPAGDSKILPGDISADGKKFVASYDNGAVRLWDLRVCITMMKIDENNPLMHSGGCTKVAHDKASPFFMSGVIANKIVFSPHAGPVGAIECMAFSPSADIRLAATVTLSEHISIWDSSKFNLLTNFEPARENDGITEMR